MKQKNKVILLFSTTAALVIIFMPLFGKLYELIIGRQLVSIFWGPINPQLVDGFFMSYVFFVTLVTAIFIKNNKSKILIIALGIILLIDLFLGAWEGLIINIGIVIVAWVLAQAVVAIKLR